MVFVSGTPERPIEEMTIQEAQGDSQWGREELNREASMSSIQCNCLRGRLQSKADPHLPNPPLSTPQLVENLSQ